MITIVTVLMNSEHLRIDDPEVVRIETTGRARDAGRDHGRECQVLRHVDADRDRKRLVLLQPAHRAAEMRVRQPAIVDVGDERDREHEIIVRRSCPERERPEPAHPT